MSADDFGLLERQDSAADTVHGLRCLQLLGQVGVLGLSAGRATCVTGHMLLTAGSSSGGLAACAALRLLGMLTQIEVVLDLRRWVRESFIQCNTAH